MKQEAVETVQRKVAEEKARIEADIGAFKAEKLELQRVR